MGHFHALDSTLGRCLGPRDPTRCGVGRLVSLNHRVELVENVLAVECYRTTRATVWMLISTLSLTRRNKVLGFFMPHCT